MTSQRRALLSVLNRELPPGAKMHGWRCENPDRWPGPCGCADTMADMILDALSAAPPSDPADPVRAGGDEVPVPVLPARRSRVVSESLYQITSCGGVVHIKCEHAIKCSRCGGDGEVAGNAAHTVPPVICPSCGGTGFKRHALTPAPKEGL